jgi:hypothetical protein
MGVINQLEDIGEVTVRAMRVTMGGAVIMRVPVRMPVRFIIFMVVGMNVSRIVMMSVVRIVMRVVRSRICLIRVLPAEVNHPDLPAGDAVLDHVPDLDLSVAKVELARQIEKLLMGIGEGGEGSEKHVAGRAGGGLEVEGAHCGRRRMRKAAMAAP